MNNISDRMKAIADCVIKGQPAADIGTDHGLVPLYLLSEGICPSVILTDISAASLNKGRENFAAAGYNGDFRTGDGISPVKEAEVSTVIIAGMGGELISRILGADIAKARSYPRLILQPRKRTPVLRKFLYENGFAEKAEKLVREGTNICEIIVAEPLKPGQRAVKEDYYIPKLLYDEEYFKDYVEMYLGRIQVVLDNLSRASVCDAERFKFWQERKEQALMIKNRLL